MVGSKFEARSVDAQYLAWEGLVRAACASAATQSRSVGAVTVSHRTDELSGRQVEAIVGFARGMAHDRRLAVEVEQTPGRLVLRFSSTPGPETPDESEPNGFDLRAIWHRLVWSRRE